VLPAVRVVGGWQQPSGPSKVNRPTRQDGAEIKPKAGANGVEYPEIFWTLLKPSKIRDISKKLDFCGRRPSFILSSWPVGQDQGTTFKSRQAKSAYNVPVL
jgi:hypothetical protein